MGLEWFYKILLYSNGNALYRCEDREVDYVFEPEERFISYVYFRFCVLLLCKCVH
jgi:hypothetical protein